MLKERIRRVKKTRIIMLDTKVKWIQVWKDTTTKTNLIKRDLIIEMKGLILECDK